MKRKAFVSKTVIIDSTAPAKISFAGTVAVLKNKVGESGIELLDEDISNAVNVAPELLKEYIEKDEAPPEVLQALNTTYSAFLKNVEVIKISFKSLGRKFWKDD